MSDTGPTTLILKHANKSRLGVIDWGPNDFDISEGTRRNSRIDGTFQWGIWTQALVNCE